MEIELEGVHISTLSDSIKLFHSGVELLYIPFCTQFMRTIIHTLIIFSTELVCVTLKNDCKQAFCELLF